MANRRVIISGAATGIGKAIATKLAEDGFDLALHCNSHKDKALELKNELEEKFGVKCQVLCFNLTDTENSSKEILEDIKNNGAYWGVVSNAGITQDMPFPGMNFEDWYKVINVNLNGFFNLVNPCIMPMVRLRNGGRIVAVSSLSGVVGNRGQANYSASKAGVIGACKSLALELAKRKITVNCVAPGLIDTGMVSEEVKEHALPLVPMGRMGEPKEVAATVSFLMSEGASYITREVININGGMA